MLQRKSFWLLCFISLFLLGITNNTWAQRWNPSHSVGTVSGNYNYQYGQTPDQLVEIFPAAIATGSLQYQWQSSATLNEGDFQAAPGTNNQTGYSPGQLFQTIYYRRKTTYTPNGTFVYSNIVKLSLVSANWENRNYIREYEVQVTGVTTGQALDQLPIGQKTQTTSYVDGLGRSVEEVSREIATPAQPGGQWGDVVQFSQYDALGRKPVTYFPYTTTTESGKFKTTAQTEQPQYYSAVYNETSAFSSITYNNSPLNRVMNVKEGGAAWAAGPGVSAQYDINTATDNVQYYAVDYVQGNPPVYKGVYAAGALYKLTVIDENGKQVVTYRDKEGQEILKKVQLDDAPATAHTGWLCTYSIYDEMGQLRYQLQPEAVKYLEANSWSFAGTNGTTVLNELCYQYNYDDQGRMIWRKAPGVAPLNRLYDLRDRLVFSQNGNQAAGSTPQWTASLYDELDRPVIITLYNTTKTITALQTDIASGVPVSSNDLGNASVTTILKYQYYDDYSFAGAKAFNTGFTNTTAYSTSDPNVLPIAASQRTIDLPTGSQTRVLGTNTFLAGTIYYDEKGNAVQNLEDNIKGGTDITTHQYHFDGRILSACNSHTTSGTGYSNFITLNKYNFDRLGRIVSIDKQLGSNAFKTIVSNDYDDLGHVKIKHLDPNYSTGGRNGLENLIYSINIHNQVTGINKDYALKNAANYNKWEHFFGMYLGFDNRDNVLSRGLLNGQVAGVVWNTQGDDAQRKYEYTYDNANRLTSATFTEKQHPGDGWASNTMDFSVTGNSGKITYDLNGNLLNMMQKGVQPGNASPLVIDNLNYTYASLSNKLQSVTDAMTATSVNGQFGDFKDGSNGSAPDYVYDNNGNVVIDLNKNAKDLGNVTGANGIHYNYLDKPDEIRIPGKGTIKIVYSATGEKLQRTYTPETGDATTTTYINQFVYQATGSNPDALSFINMEEGRIRVITPVAQNNGNDAMAIDGNLDLPNNKKGVYDYFIKDYQENVRMILTEETHSAYNTCSMESNRYLAEDPVFGQSGAGNEVEATRTATPAGWQSTNTTASVSLLGTNAGHNIGPNTLQKVMAGDQVSATVQYYYQDAATSSNPNFVSTLLTSLGQAITGSPIAANAVKANAAGITSGLNGTSGFVNAVQPAGSGGTTPQAYLTILFFDERFKFIEAADGGVAQQQVAASGAGAAPLGLGSVKAPKNGYVYVYVSNRSDQNVYFDNLQVGINRGNIIEENHYYAYGLKIAAISSRKPVDINEGKLKNDFLYNDKELFDDGDLNWYDYGFRNYDVQTGRFVQVDPLTDDYPFLSGYSYAGSDPVNKVDVDGLFGGIATSFETAGSLASVVVVGHTASAVSASVNLGRVALSVTSVTIQVAARASSAINGSFSSFGDTPYQQGFKDGYHNAILVGVPQLYNGWKGYDPLDQFDDFNDKIEYLKGRIAGDLAAALQGSIEIESGGGTAAAGLATGPAAVVVTPAGGIVALHGGATGAVAAADGGISTGKLIKLESILKATSPKMSAKSRPSSEPKGDLHHISTNKHDKWTKLLEPIFKKAGLDINTAPENLVRVMNHQGPHPEIYHEQVYYRLLKATENAKTKKAFRDAVIKELRRIGLDCATPGKFLNDLITKGNIL